MFEKWLMDTIGIVSFCTTCRLLLSMQVNKIVYGFSCAQSFMIFHILNSLASLVTETFLSLPFLSDLLWTIDILCYFDFIILPPFSCFPYLLCSSHFETISQPSISSWILFNRIFLVFFIDFMIWNAPSEWTYSIGEMVLSPRSLHDQIWTIHWWGS